MAEQVAFINVGPIWRRAPLVLVAMAALFGAWYGMRWLVGNTMAEYARDFETAEAAARLAPDDPAAYLRLARLHRLSYEPGDLSLALEEYERAAALAPNDYLIWTEYGRALGSSGETERGLVALRRAVALAPSYAEPRWHYGNLLLRAGRTDEAFAELGLAAEAEPQRYGPQVFNLAWHLFGGDVGRVVEVVGNRPQARARIITMLVGMKRFDDARAIWSALDAASKREQSEAGSNLARALYVEKKYRQALRVLQDFSGGPGADLADGKIVNGSFESDVAASNTRLFNWNVVPNQSAQVALDPRTARSGARSLRIVLNASYQMSFADVSQLIIVEPSARYRLSFWVRTEELKSASTPLVHVLNAAAGGAALVSSAPAPTGTNDWKQVTLDFTTPPQVEAVQVKLDRAQCPAESCPIFGKIWYDDFELQRIGGSAAAR